MASRPDDCRRCKWAALSCKQRVLQHPDPLSGTSAAVSSKRAHRKVAEQHCLPCSRAISCTRSRHRAAGLLRRSRLKRSQVLEGWVVAELQIQRKQHVQRLQQRTVLLGDGSAGTVRPLVVVVAEAGGCRSSTAQHMLANVGRSTSCSGVGGEGCSVSRSWADHGVRLRPACWANCSLSLWPPHRHNPHRRPPGAGQAAGCSQCARAFPATRSGGGVRNRLNLLHAV